MKKNQSGNSSDFFNNLDSSEARRKTAKQIMSGLSPEDSEKLSEILGDRDKLNTVLNSPAAQAILSKLNGHR